MTDNPLPNGAAPRASDVTEQNLERLLEKAYKPEAPDPEFAQRLRDRLVAAARDRAQPALPLRRPLFGRRFFAVLAAAAAIAGLALLFNYLATPRTHVQPFADNLQPPDDEQPPPRKVLPAPEQTPAEPTLDAQPAPPHYAEHLTPRPRPQAPEVRKLAVGDSLDTKAGERRRVALADGSVLYLNEKTALKLDAERHVTLSSGEVFVEVAPRPAEEGAAARFVVKTPQREVVALGTKFDVAAFGIGTGITVTQGKVQVSGLDDVLTAGQQLAPDAKQASAAPRAAVALAWTRELMCAAEAPLVPPSKYAGGAVVVNDPSGQSAQLSLRKYHVDVHVEDGFARTTIDQTYFNAEMRRLEGTFYFPLPPDASLSRLAMYVNGQLMEGGMAERDFARQTFENIVRRMQDPALLEWVDGSTFKMRVFPLEPRQEKRIVLSYTQRLPAQYGRTSYRFPAGHSLEAVRDWSFHARVKGGKTLTWASDTHGETLQARTEKADLLLDAEQKNVTQFRDVALDLYDGTMAPLAPVLRGEGPGVRGLNKKPLTPGPSPRSTGARGESESARFSSMDHDSARYFQVRYRPELPTGKERRHRDWVFLFESSGDRDPLLARTQIEVVRTLLNNAEHDDTFAVVTAATRAGTFAKEAKPVTGENVTSAIQFLEGTHLAGMLDLGLALDAAEPFLKSAQNPYLVHVGSGLSVLGETKADVLAKRIPDGTHYVGVGVGKRWSRALMKQAAERSAGFFAQINPDEAVNWRAFELYSALTAPRLLDVTVVDNAEKASFLTHTSTVAQGEEVCAIARLEAGVKLPESVTVTGTLDGKTFSRSVPVKEVASETGYLPRTWAKLEIERLLAAGAQANKARIVQLSMASYVMTPFTSLLVLENEQMYQQYGVDRGRKDHWAMYPCPQTIPVVQEWPNGAPAPKAAPVAKPNAEDVLGTILVRVPPRAFADGAAANLPRAVTVRDLYLGAYGVPVSVVMDRPGNNQVFSFWMGFSDGGGKGGTADPKAGEPRRPDEVRGGGDAKSPLTVPVSGGTTAPPPSIPPVPAPVSPVGGPMPGFGGGGMMPPGGGGFGLSGGFGGLGGGLGGGGFPGSRITSSPGGFPGGSSFSGGGSSFAGSGGPGNFPGSTGSTTYAPYFVSPTQQWAGSGPSPYSYFPATGYYNGYIAPNQFHPRDEDRKGGRKGDKLLQSFDSLRPGSKETGQRRYDDDRYDDKTALRRELKEMEQLKKLLAEESKEDSWKDKKRLDLEDENGLIDLEQRLDHLRARHAAARVAAPGWATSLQPGSVRPDGLLYHAPTFAPDGRTFSDLVSYAPGLNTNAADVLGVLEAEAASDPADDAGKVEPAARALIEAARASGWRTLTVPAANGNPAWSVAFDGSGRYAIERVLPSGLKEQVVCDGKELLHLYPELGLGARRTVTRFHRAELGDLVPWALPPAKDLAHGYDVTTAGEHTVALLPRGLKADHPAIVVHLVFGEDGRLDERRLVELPKNKVLRRETYGTDGTLKVIDGDGKELSARKLAIKAGGAPDLLDVDTKELVVLPMPLRTREHVFVQPGAAGGDLNTMDRPSWLAVLGADSATGNAAWLQSEIQVRAWNLSDNRPGFNALLLSAGYDFNALPVPANAGAPLARYVAWLKQTEQLADNKDDLGDGLLRRLVGVQSLVRAWQNGPNITDEDAARGIKAIREAKSPVFVWAVVVEALRIPDRKVTAKGGRPKLQRDVLEAACAALKDVPGLSYAARYELARHLAENAERGEARKQFAELYRETAKSGTLPPLDRGFRQTLQAYGKEPDLFGSLLRETADRWVKEGRRVAAVALAWQCWELEAPALADDLLTRALDGIADRDRRAAPTLAAVEYLAQTHQYDRADKLLQGLLADEKLARHAGLWRMGYQLALQRKQPARAYACLAQALEMEYRDLPEWIDVQAVRQDYGALLGYYAEVVRATAMLGQKPPADLTAKVVRAADRWRCLDVDGSAACASAFQSLRGLGDADVAWDYLLMSSGAEQEGFSWVTLAQSLQQQEDFDLAERAYKQACLGNPANADLMRLRADNLLRAGHAAEGRELLREIGEVPAVVPAPTLPEGVKPPPPGPATPLDKKE